MILRLCMIASMLLTMLCAKAEAQTNESEYQRLVRQAIAEYAEHNFAEARALFARAHALEPNARTLRGLGMTAFELRSYAEVYRVLTAAPERSRWTSKQANKSSLSSADMMQTTTALCFCKHADLK